MSDRPLIAIFGAAVLKGGRASPALARRIQYGRQAAEQHGDAPILCSGGVGRHWPSEASVMAESLARHGIARDRLILDEASLDTLQSAVVAARLARERGHGHVVVCSDRYHMPRVRLLIGALGVRATPGPVWPGRGGAPFGNWTWMMLREGLAIPYDVAIVLTRRRALAEPAS